MAEAVRHYQDLCRSLEQQVKEAHDEMDDYTETTKELQQELETELDKVDKSEKGMRLALEAADNDKEEWKVTTPSAHHIIDRALHICRLEKQYAWLIRPLTLSWSDRRPSTRRRCENTLRR